MMKGILYLIPKLNVFSMKDLALLQFIVMHQHFQTSIQVIASKHWDKGTTHTKRILPINQDLLKILIQMGVLFLSRYRQK